MWGEDREPISAGRVGWGVSAAGMITFEQQVCDRQDRVAEGNYEQKPNNQAEQATEIQNM